MIEDAIHISQLSFSYQKEKILNQVSIQVRQGEIVALIGPNGSGKSTLLKCTNRLLKVKDGDVSIKGIPLKKMKQSEIAHYISYVPQNTNIVYPMTVFESILVGLRQSSHWRYRKEDMEQVERLLAKLKLTELAHKSLNELSGGQKQKVAIARALIRETPFLLLDEPTNHLDMSHQRDMVNILIESSRTQRQGILIVLHDINIAVQLADRIVLLDKGMIVAEGTPAEVINHENILTAYDVDVEMVHHNHSPFIIGYK